MHRTFSSIMDVLLPLRLRRSFLTLLFLYAQYLLLLVVCTYLGTPFLQLRASLLNHLYFLCLLGPLNTLCHSWFYNLQMHALVCPCSWMSVFCFHSQFQHILTCVIQATLSRYFFFLNFSLLPLALLISLFLGHSVGLSFRWSAFPGSPGSLNIPSLDHSLYSYPPLFL